MSTINFKTSIETLVELGLVSDKQLVAWNRKLHRRQKQADKLMRQAVVNDKVWTFLNEFMKPGTGYSVKPQGKSKSKAILPWLQAESDITREECLNALKAWRADGLLETNQAEVRNNCQIRWFLAGTRGQPEAGEEGLDAEAK